MEEAINGCMEHSVCMFPVPLDEITSCSSSSACDFLRIGQRTDTGQESLLRAQAGILASFGVPSTARTGTCWSQARGGAQK